MKKTPFLSFVTFLLVWLPVLAQETEEAGAEEEVYFETVDVTVVNIVVFVTDKKGNPITGLTKDDFEVFEKRRPVVISNFYAVEGGIPRTEFGGVDPKDADGSPAASTTERPSVPDDQKLHLVVYIDNFNIRPFNRNRVFRRLREFLQESIDSDDLVMLVSYDRSLKYRQKFTGDPQLVTSALFDLESVTGYEVHRDGDRREIIRAIDEAESVGDVLWRVTQYAENLHNDLSFTIDALKEIVGSLAGLQGRKALLSVSDGLALVPGEEFYYTINRKFNDSSVMTRARDYDLSRRFRELAAHANSTGVTFYTIDAAGLRTPESMSVQMSTPGLAGQASFTDSVRVHNLQSPLILLANETGGQAIYNTNDVSAGLARVATDFDTYYSLGYTPAHSGSGRYYKIEVKLKRKGLKVRHRSGYRDKPLYSRMEEGTLSTLRYGFEKNPLELKLQIEEGQKNEDDQFEVPILISIPLDNIVLVPREEYHVARLKLYVGAMDDRGWLSPVTELKLPIQIANGEVENARGRLYVYEDKLLIRSGTHRIAVGLWDEFGAVGSFIIRTVNVGGG